jgi:hypothetical protein
MVDISDIRAMQNDARILADDLGVVTIDLTDKELTRFGRSFARQFIVQSPTKEVMEVYLRHQKEALLGGMIAKQIMNAEVDDEIPASNKIGGPIPIRAPYLGIGYDWEDIRGIYGVLAQNQWTTGAPQPWIHSGTTLMGGVRGNPIRIGTNAVHVIWGIGDINPAPKMEAMQFTVDGKQKPMIYNAWAWKQAPALTQLFKEFDNAFILKKDTTFLATILYSANFGGPSAFVTDYPVLWGVSYIKEPVLRVLDGVTARILPGINYDTVYLT